jgi:hypothetical protein
VSWRNILWSRRKNVDYGRDDWKCLVWNTIDKLHHEQQIFFPFSSHCLHSFPFWVNLRWFCYCFRCLVIHFSLLPFRYSCHAIWLEIWEKSELSISHLATKRLNFLFGWHRGLTIGNHQAYCLSRSALCFHQFLHRGDSKCLVSSLKWHILIVLIQTLSFLFLFEICPTVLNVGWISDWGRCWLESRFQNNSPFLRANMDPHHHKSIRCHSSTISASTKRRLSRISRNWSRAICDLSLTQYLCSRSVHMLWYKSWMELKR